MFNYESTLICLSSQWLSYLCAIRWQLLLTYFFEFHYASRSVHFQVSCLWVLCHFFCILTCLWALYPCQLLSACSQRSRVCIDTLEWHDIGNVTIQPQLKVMEARTQNLMVKNNNKNTNVLDHGLIPPWPPFLWRNTRRKCLFMFVIMCLHDVIPYVPSPWHNRTGWLGVKTSTY